MTMRNDRIASSYVAVTKSDTTQLNLVALYVGGTGDVTVKGEDGVAALFSACPVGFVLYGRIINVMSTGTTATLLTGYTP